MDEKKKGTTTDDFFDPPPLFPSRKKIQKVHFLLKFFIFEFVLFHFLDLFRQILSSIIIKMYWSELSKTCVPWCSLNKNTCFFKGGGFFFPKFVAFCTICHALLLSLEEPIFNIFWREKILVKAEILLFHILEKKFIFKRL